MNIKSYIVTPTWNNEDYTIRCFDSIKKNTKNYKIIWIDNGSGKASREKVEKFLDDNDVSYELIANEENLGFVKATNQGMKRAMELNAKYVILQNNDTEVYEGWLDRMIEVAERDEKIGLVGPITSPCASWQSIDNIRKIYDSHFNNLPVYENNPEEYAELIKNLFKGEIVKTSEYLAFFSTLIKRKTIETTGFLSEDFGVGFGDDNDYCVRAKKIGWKLVVAKDVFVFHNHRTTFKSIYSEEKIGEMLSKNGDIYKKKHENFLELEHAKKILDNQNHEDSCPYCGKIGVDNVHIKECEKESPLISVIIPSRVDEDILSLETLKAQTYKNIEIIIEYDHKKEGASAVRNKGARKAKGEYYFFCDNDLVLSPSCISDLYLALKSNSSAKWSFGKFYIDGRLFNGRKSLKIPQLGTVEWIEYFHGMSTMSLINASVFPGFDEDMKRYNDWDLWLTLNKKGFSPVFCDKILFSTRNRKNGISSQDCEDMKRWKNKLYVKHEVDVEGEILSLREFVKQDALEIQQIKLELEFIKSSKFWKLRERYVGLKNLNIHYVLETWKKAFFVLKKEGLGVFCLYLYKFIVHGRGYFKFNLSSNENYNIWIEKRENINADKVKNEIDGFEYKPKISIITPVYNVSLKLLDECIQSVLDQVYSEWELCLYDDCSTNSETIDCLKKWEKVDSRIKISYGKINQHISGASNEALKMASGEFVALLDNDDTLSVDALYEVAKCLNNNPEIDFIYSDEDKINIDGKREEPFFKPDFSIDLLLSMNYITHLSIFKRSIIEKIGGFRKGYEGAQDYDLILRFVNTINSNNIFHISKILYHWRKSPESTAGGAHAKSYAYIAAKKALADYLHSNKIKGEILDGEFTALYRIKRELINYPLVSIIIPFRDEVKVLKKCIDSVIKKTDYSNYEIILVNNQSKERETIEYLETIKLHKNIEVLEYDKPFNYSAINNYAVSKVESDYILFLNNDTEVINANWLTSMMEHAQRDDVGIVGAKLLYPTNKIQHAGVIMGIGIASHAFKNMPAGRFGYFGFLNVIRNYSAVTAACLLTKKELFIKAGGFNEKDLAIAFNDVDYCLKIRELGYLVVYTPYAELYHYESLSRGNDNELEKTNPEKFKRVLLEREYMKNKWLSYIENDPYYNKNLTRSSEDFSVRIR